MKAISLHQQQASEWFVRLRDPEATEAQWLAFVEWIESDPSCRAAYDQIEQTWIDIDAAVERPQAVPVAANDHAPRPAGSRRWLLAGLAVAASAAICVGIWPSLSGPSVETYVTEAQPRTVTLSDGSTVWLNRNSGLEARIGKTRRDIVMNEGEAAFDVTHDTTRPFTVQAGEQSVRVLGTAFDIIRQDKRFVVQVSRGAVAVTPAGAAAVVRLSVGQKLHQSGREAVVLSSTDAQAVAARRQGVLVYRDASMREVADDLSLYLHKPVIVDAAAGALKFSGVLKADDEVTFLDQLEDFAPVRIDHTSTEVRITAR